MSISRLIAALCLVFFVISCNAGDNGTNGPAEDETEEDSQPTGGSTY